MKMTLTRDDLQAISDIFDARFDEKFDKKLDEVIEKKLDKKLDEKFEREFAPMKEDIRIMKGDIRDLKGSVDLLNVRVSRNTRKLRQLDLSVRHLEYISDKRFARLQDGMDTVEAILKMNHMIPC